jgi:carbon-monoxide dehydrogenase small subunit
MTRITLTVNGKPITAEVAPRLHLADFLREHLLLTGTHIGCEHGICGACTVEIDGEIARSCITYAVTCDGAEVRTIEGFDDDPLMARLRQAFTEEHALQCGYCTPGMLVAARDLVRRKRGLTREDIRLEMSGNLCRCTGYMGIVNAIERVMADGAAHQAAPARPRLWLGPAPGPEAMTPRRGAAPKVATAGEARHPAAPMGPRGPEAKRAPIKVTVSSIETVEGQTSLTQTFVLPHPREAVWQFLANPQEVARCMPGMVLDGPPQDGRVTGRMEVKLGPIAASFAGEGTIVRFADEYRQVIEGRGGDRRSGSRATGRIDLRLLPAEVSDSEATQVQARISYALSGPLAQFSRSGLVRELVARIGEAFAQNVDARLGGAESIAPAKLHGFSLLLRAIAAQVRELVRRLFGRTP